MATDKSRHEGSLHVTGNFSTGTLSIPNGTIQNVAVGASAAIDATKLEHQHALIYHQVDGTDVAAAIVPLFICRGATATIIAIQAVCLDAPSGSGDEEITVDLKKCNEGSPSPATVLSAPISITSPEHADCEVVTATISSASLVAGDTLVLDVAQTGSSETKGQGLVVTVTIREDAE